MASSTCDAPPLRPAPGSSGRWGVWRLASYRTCDFASFLDQHNVTARPFVRTKTADDMIVAIRGRGPGALTADECAANPDDLHKAVTNRYAASSRVQKRQFPATANNLRFSTLVV